MSTDFAFDGSEISGIVIIDLIKHTDSRGWVLESFNDKKFTEKVGKKVIFVQDNHSFSKQQTLRGLHFQTNQSQGKLVRVIAGAIYDVTVDLRVSSSTYKNWFGIHLTAQNFQQIWIPPGVAHGYLVLSEFAEVQYKTTEYYDPKNESCLIWSDSEIGIKWPVGFNFQPIMSQKDLNGLTWNLLPKIEY